MFLMIASYFMLQNSWAQEDMDKEEVVKTFEELGIVTPFRVTAFRDKVSSGDCDPVEARYGRCVELVDFYQPTPVWYFSDYYSSLSDVEKKTAENTRLMKRYLYQYPNASEWQNLSDEKAQKKYRRQDKATQRLVSELYAETWENIVFQWKEADDPGALAMKNDGFKVTPNAPNQWGYSLYPNRGLTSEILPEQYLEAMDWYQGMLGQKSSDLADLQNHKAFYPRVKQSFPEGYLAQPKSSVLLSGRFAERLGFKNRVYDYNLMDADPRSSGPFFEQIYPYNTIYRSEDLSFIPLVDFRYPTSQVQLDPSSTRGFVMVDDIVDAEAKASQRFNDFYRLVSSQIMQFAMQDYTSNHMRIFGAITLMRSPPSSLEEATGISRNLNASAQGQTDSNAELEKRVDRDAYSVPGGFRLNYAKIPDILLIQWLQQLSQEYPPMADFYFNLTSEAEAAFQQLLKTSRATLLKGVSDEDFIKWINENTAPGVDGNVILKPIRQMALQQLMATLPEDKRDKEETWLLLDHFNYSVISSMDNTVGIRISPSQITDVVSLQWETVLSDHYYTTTKIDQGLGAVDPTAVCTTKDRLSALDETTVGAIYVDQIFMGEDSHINPELTKDELLWSARDSLPIFMFDNPNASTSSVERIVSLPDGQALYRARWVLWSGWHLMWGVENIDGKERLTLKTGALCDNMVLTSPDLVPTIVRAGLLEDNFYPTTPAKRSDKNGAEAKKKKKKSALGTQSEQSLNVTKAVNKTVNTAKNLKATKDIVTGTVTDPNAMQIGNAKQADLSTKELERHKQKPVSIDQKESVDYLKRIVQQPLKDLSTEEKGLLLVVEDIDTVEPFSLLRDGFSHTPYSRAHKMTGLEHVKGAAWAYYFPKTPDAEIAKSSPAYVPRANYEAGALVPSFKRKSSTDTSFVGDVGLFPIRTSYYTCDADVNGTSLSSVEKCNPDTKYNMTTDGLFFAASSYRTVWFRDDPRLAYELGLSMQLDILHSGKSWFHATDMPDISIVGERLNGQTQEDAIYYPNYSWALRPQTGASFGFRHLLDPMPQHRYFRTSSPWGAMNSSGEYRAGRAEWGMRGAFLVGPSYNGLEGSLIAELWTAGLLRNPKSDWAYFSAYHPILDGGPFVQYKRGGVLLPSDETRVFNLLYSDTFVVGWRTQFRLREKRPE